MDISNDRRKLLKAASVLGLSLGMTAGNFGNANAAGYLKLGDIDGERVIDSRLAGKKWTQVRIERNQLILATDKGEEAIAKQGIFRLRNGKTINVKNGKIVK